MPGAGIRRGNIENLPIGREKFHDRILDLQYDRHGERYLKEKRDAKLKKADERRRKGMRRHKAGGLVKQYKAGGSVKKRKKPIDGAATRGKTRGVVR